MAILSEAVGLITDISGIFKGKEPTPEEQKQKAGVWYKMLQDFVLNNRSSQQLASLWRDQLPFAQKSTKQRFMNNNIVGKSNDFIINVLVGKINDELIKGGFQAITKETILSGMGAGSLTAESPAGLSVVNAGAGVSDLTATDLDVRDVNESRIYFFVGAVLLLTVGVLTWLFFIPKKRRR